MKKTTWDDFDSLGASASDIDGNFISKQELLYTSLFQSSSLNSRANYEDTALSLFADTFVDLSNWSTTTKLQVLDNKLYSTTGSGGSSGINHSYPISSTEKMRAIIRFNIPAGITSGGIIVGVSTDAAGAVPAVTAGNVYGLYLNAGGAKQANAGSFTDLINSQGLYVGEYIAVITIDANYISVIATGISNPSIEYAMRVSRVGISVNNIYIFNSDSRTTAGSYISNVSVRKGLGSLYPRDNIEGIVKTIQWTGNGVDNFRVYLPKDYDSRRTYPCIIGFHGLGTNEYQWSINGNMVNVQKALVDAGYIFLTCSYSSSSSTWGNKLGTTSYYKGYKYLIDNYSICSIGFYGNSMGGIESLNAICNEQIPCSVWVGTSPSSNLKNIYDTAMFTSGVKTAYSISSDGSDYEEKTNGFDPMLNNINKFKGIPMLFIAAEDDAAVNTVNNTDLFLSKISPYSLEARKISVATGGHSFSNSPYLTNITAFFNKYLKNIY